MAVNPNKQSGTYELLLSLSTSIFCSYNCQILQNGKTLGGIKGKSSRSIFKSLYYNFYTFSGLNQGQQYSYSCTNDPM